MSTQTPTTPRSRVIVVQDDLATEAFRPKPERVRPLVRAGLMEWSGKKDASQAWKTLLNTQDIVGIKVYSLPGAQVGTRPPVVEGVIETLLEAGVPPPQIVIWDRRLVDLQRAGFDEVARRYRVKLASSVESGWDGSASYESSLLGQLVHGDREFQSKEESAGRRSFVTRLLTTEITKIVNVSPLLNHNSAGVCGSLYSLTSGSVDNWLRFEGEPGKLAAAVPEIFALPAVGDRVVLHIVDALICQYRGEQIGRLHYSAMLNQLRFSTDPVALDLLSINEMDRFRRGGTNVAGQPFVPALYRNAALLELGTAEWRDIDLHFTHP